MRVTRARLLLQGVPWCLACDPHHINLSFGDTHHITPCSDQLLPLCVCAPFTTHTELSSPQLSHGDTTDGFSPAAVKDGSAHPQAAAAATLAGGGGSGGAAGSGSSAPAGWGSGRHTSGELNLSQLDVEKVGSGGMIGEEVHCTVLWPCGCCRTTGCVHVCALVVMCPSADASQHTARQNASALLLPACTHHSTACFTHTPTHTMPPPVAVYRPSQDACACIP